jgi:hypothetical protein
VPCLLQLQVFMLRASADAPLLNWSNVHHAAARGGGAFEVWFHPVASVARMYMATFILKLQRLLPC